jgi:phage shock protein PspC (stress-responsive transcriptional regulator)
MNKKLYRDEYHRVLGGVCSGLAEYFEMDVTIIRLLFAFTFFIMGAGLGTYIILWIVLPRKPYPFNSFGNPTVDYTVRRKGRAKHLLRRHPHSRVHLPTGRTPIIHLTRTLL